MNRTDVAVGPPAGVAHRPPGAGRHPPGSGRRTKKQVDRLRFDLDPLRVALFLLTIVTISRFHQHFGFMAKVRPALMLTAAVGVYALLNPQALAPGNLFRTWPAKVVGGLGIMACLSTAFGISMGSSAVFILENYSKVLVYCFLLMVGIRATQDLALLIWAYVVSSGLLVYLSLFVFGLSKSEDAYNYRLGNMYTYDANDAGVVLLVGLPLAILTFQAFKGNKKWLSALILFGIGATIARTGSRGAFVGLLALGLALFFLLATVPIAKRLMFMLLTVVALIVGAPPGYWQQMETLKSPTEDYNWKTEDGRKAVAERGLQYMLRYPMFGLGINNFNRAEGTLSDKAIFQSVGRGVRWTAAHNSYVQAGAEMGIPGLTLWCLLIFGGMVAMVRLRLRLPRWWAKGDAEQRFLYNATIYLPVAWAGFSIGSFFVSFAYHDPAYVLAAFMTGVYVCVERKLRGPTPHPTPVRRGRRGRAPGWRTRLPT